MNNDLRSGIILLILGAIIAGFQFLGKELFHWYKNYQIRKERRKEKNKTDNQKSIELFDKLVELNEKENKYRELENHRMMDNNMAVLQNQKITGDIINDIILNTDVDRFVLFHTHNGSGQPNYFKPYKVSYLQYNAINPSQIHKYQNIEVDSEYTKMLINIQEDKNHRMFFRVDEMEDSLLKSIYKKEKIKYAEIYFLCATSTGIIYTSLATTKDITNYSEYRFDINMAIAKLKSVFDEEHSRVFIDAIVREENETRLKEVYRDKELLKQQLDNDQTSK